MLSNEVIARKVAQIYNDRTLTAYTPGHSKTAIFKGFVAVLKFISEAFDINLSSVSKRSGHHSSTKLTEDSAGKFSGTP